MKYTYIFEKTEDEFFNQGLKVGDNVLVWSKKYIVKDKEEYHINKYMAENGYPAHFHNDKVYMANAPTYFHGDRGGNSIYTLYAHGVYKIKSIELFQKNFNEYYKIILHKTDLKKNEP